MSLSIYTYTYTYTCVCVCVCVCVCMGACKDLGPPEIGATETGRQVVWG